MDTVHQLPDTAEQAGPRVTPYFTAVVEAEAARRGLPPEAA